MTDISTPPTAPAGGRPGGREAGDARGITTSDIVFTGLAIVTLVAINALVFPVAGLLALLIIVAGALVMGSRQPLLISGGYVILLFGFPSQYAFGPFALTPASALGYVAFVLWVAGRVTRIDLPRLHRSPVTLGIAAFFAVALLSYANGQLRVLSGPSGNQSDNQLLLLISGAGMALFIIDTVRTPRQLRLLVGSAVVGGVVLAVVALIQWFTDFDPTTELRPPGFRLTVEAREVRTRFGFERVRGTTASAIEFSAVLAAVLPLAIFLSGIAATRRARLAAAGAALLIGATLPTAISRTAIVAGGLAVLVAVLGLDSRRRFRVIIVVTVAVIALGTFVQPVRETTAQLLVGLVEEDQDNNVGISGRTGDYSVARSLFVDRPVLGRGFATFNPSEDRRVDGRTYTFLFLDNQYLKTAIESGTVGLLALLALPLSAISVTRRIRRSSQVAEYRDLAHALFAILVVAMTSWGFYSVFNFVVATGFFMFTLGLVGALRVVATSPFDSSLTGRRPTTAS